MDNAIPAFPYHQDPGHGWVEVPRALLAELGILDRISSYSYQRGETVYLEEDCDASLWASTMRTQGRPFAEVPVYHKFDAPMRAMSHFRV